MCICHVCKRPTFLDHQGSQHPGAPFGAPVGDVPEASVSQLYEEARRATAAGAYTAAVLCCRMLLMHIVVAKGAAENQTFLAYVEFLANKSYVPPEAAEWIDHIRKRGNEANHEISISPRTDAEDLVAFCEMLLRVIYEFPARAKRRGGGLSGAT